MATKTFCIYEDRFGVGMIEESRVDSYLKSFGPGKVLHSFEATSYVNACQQFNDYCGFGEYKPMIDLNTGKPYPEDIAEFE